MAYFFKKLEESWKVGPSKIFINNLFGLDSRKFNMLSEYLNAVDEYKIDMRREANKYIKYDQNNIDKINSNRFFKDVKELEKLQKSIEQTNEKLTQSLKILSSIPDEIVPLYQQMINSCPHKEPRNIALIYNEGLLGFITGDYEASLDRINEFVIFAETSGSQSFFNSKVFQTQGESFLEVGLYFSPDQVLIN